MLVGEIMDIGVRNLADSEAEMIWAINEEGLPGTGKVSQQEIKALLEFSSLSIGAYLEDRLVVVLMLLKKLRPFTRRMRFFLQMEVIGMKKIFLKWQLMI